MSFMMILEQMLSLFFIMVVGYLAYKAHIIDDGANVRLTKVVLNISLPAQILVSFLANRGMVSNQVLFQVFGISALCYVVYAVVSGIFIVLLRVPKKQRGVYSFMLLFGNVGFMGYPVIQAIFGQEGMIYAVCYNVIFCILVYSLGILLIGEDKSGKFDPKLLLNAPMISAVISIVLFFTDIQIPVFMNTALDYMGNLTTPLAMLILGSSIAKMPLKELFDEWRVYIFAVFRLFVIPGAVLLLLKMIPIQQEVVRNTMIVISAMPVATNTTMLAIQYQGDEELAARGIFFSTVLSVITIPVIAVLL